jgi:hypothetical protein
MEPHLHNKWCWKGEASALSCSCFVYLGNGFNSCAECNCQGLSGYSGKNRVSTESRYLDFTVRGHRQQKYKLLLCIEVVALKRAGIQSRVDERRSQPRC